MECEGRQAKQKGLPVGKIQARQTGNRKALALALAMTNHVVAVALAVELEAAAVGCGKSLGHQADSRCKRILTSHRHSVGRFHQRL